MNLTEFKNWLLSQLETIEPRIGEPPSAEWSAVVAAAKQHCYDLGFHDFALSLPDSYAVKTPLTAANQIKRCLAQIETPPPAIEGGDMSVRQAASLLGVSKETVYGLCASGDLECNRHGKRITISPRQLEEYRRLSVR